MKDLVSIERRKQAARLKRLRSEHSDLADEVERLREVLKIQDVLAAAPLVPIKRTELKSGKREATAVAMLSDLHVEERVRKSDTPSGNVYNLRVAEKRLGRCFSGVEWLINLHREKWQINNLVLWLGGDLCSGQIHEENIETSAGTPITTLLWLYPRIKSGLQQLAKTVERVDVPCSYGNHGRDTKMPRFTTGAEHSYEWGMYQRLADDFKGTNVHVMANPSEHQYHSVYGKRLHFHHGHRVNYGGGVGGIMIPVNKAVAQWDKVMPSDIHHFGHFHQYIDAGNVVMNGSLIGFNGYAMGIKATPEPPQQAFYLLDSKRGKTCKSPIWVAE